MKQHVCIKKVIKVFEEEGDDAGQVKVMEMMTEVRLCLGFITWPHIF